MARQGGRRVGLRQSPRQSALCEELPTNGGWYSRGVDGTAHELRKEISEGVEASPGPGSDTGGYKGRSRAPGAGYWGTRGGNGDNVVGVLGEAWRYLGVYGG